MKCANPKCHHGIGLVSYRRGWFNRRRFCSKKCRDEFDFAASDPSSRTASEQATTAAGARWKGTHAMSANSSATLFIPATVPQP
jgi:hypothetical protein